MNTLHIIGETFTNGYRVGLISIISIASTIFAILVITSKNPIVSILFLIALFSGIACYLFTIGLNFIGLSYLLVYIGAVSILFLFILMLINVRVSELLNETSKSIPLALIIVICLSYTISNALPFDIFNTVLNNSMNNNIENNLNYIYIRNFRYSSNNLFGFLDNGFNTIYIFSKFWDGNVTEFIHISSLGNIMYSSYSIWLIITSIILLLAMVGAIILTIHQK